MYNLLSPLYIKVYVFITLGYLWYRFFLLFLTELKEAAIKYDVHYKNQLLSVIVPFYNEDIEILDLTIKSLLEANGEKEIILVDDGSPDEKCSKLIKKKYKDKVKFVRYELNKGKRYAQAVGLKEAKGEFIITVDSDTTIDPDALINLIQPMLNNAKVGATTGNVKVLNESDNFLTKMIAARYWNAFNIERKSLSGFGIVTCCSGVLSAYPKRLFESLMPAYLGQRFLGEECTYGDDRHLTNLILKRKYKIEYVGSAVCYTDAPKHMKQFIRQQLRWKKSFLRESLISLQFAFKHSLLLPIEVLFNLIIPFLSVGIRLAIVATMIMIPSWIPVFVASVITVAIIRNFFMFFENKKLAIFSIPYAFVHEFILFWLYFVALFTLRNKSWGTR